MEEQFRFVAGYIALALELIVVLVVAVGAIDALRSLVRSAAGAPWTVAMRTCWLRFAAWILVALEFALGADIVRTAIAPTWDDIGKLGAIAAIRTVLGFFLGRDLTEIREIPVEGAGEKKEA